MEIKNPILTNLSKVISNFFNPLVSLVIYFFYYSYKNYSWEEASKKFLPILLLLIIPIAIWIYRNVKKGNYTNMDVSNRKQRHSLYIFIIIATIIFLTVDYFLHKEIDWTVLMLCILLILMQISNFFIKSSMHTSLNIYVSALFFTIEPIIGIFWFLLSILIGITRVILKRHTPKEVLIGGTIAIFVSLIYLIMVKSIIF
ncbi:phosphatase PAP2 family protein [Epilithonimonas hispanica]|uniref:ABC transporter permease n=1 Tax=Epilithonimonas hispanica TaxID=358687 RepID=A0A3D9CSB3_9FLAO|nr:phosphatase PAP2 family protein [Epilithonimonas hispanica]REC68581.1 ABC transporter permease [Epilithonimonas hispanica]